MAQEEFNSPPKVLWSWPRWCPLVQRENVVLFSRERCSRVTRGRSAGRALRAQPRQSASGTRRPCAPRGPASARAERAVPECGHVGPAGRGGGDRERGAAVQRRGGHRLPEEGGFDRRPHKPARCRRAAYLRRCPPCPRHKYRLPATEPVRTPCRQSARHTSPGAAKGSAAVRSSPSPGRRRARAWCSRRRR